MRTITYIVAAHGPLTTTGPATVAESLSAEDLRLVVSHHEAGHVCIAAALGIRTEQITHDAPRG